MKLFDFFITRSQRGEGNLAFKDGKLQAAIVYHKMKSYDKP